MTELNSKETKAHSVAAGSTVSQCVPSPSHSTSSSSRKKCKNLTRTVSDGRNSVRILRSCGSILVFSGDHFRAKIRRLVNSRCAGLKVVFSWGGKKLNFLHESNKVGRKKCVRACECVRVRATLFLLSRCEKCEEKRTTSPKARKRRARKFGVGRVRIFFLDHWSRSRKRHLVRGRPSAAAAARMFRLTRKRRRTRMMTSRSSSSSSSQWVQQEEEKEQEEAILFPH